VTICNPILCGYVITLVGDIAYRVTSASEQRLDLRFTAIDTRFEQVERQIDRMVTRLGALVVVVAGLLFGALHLWRDRLARVL